MNTILTDDEIVFINALHYDLAFRNFEADIAIARAVEAAVLAKLAQPLVPTQWREAVKVAREALKTCEIRSVSEWEVVDMTPKIVRTALAKLDRLEGGE